MFRVQAWSLSNGSIQHVEKELKQKYPSRIKSPGGRKSGRSQARRFKVNGAPGRSWSPAGATIRAALLGEAVYAFVYIRLILGPAPRPAQPHFQFKPRRNLKPTANRTTCMHLHIGQGNACIHRRRETDARGPVTQDITATQDGNFTKAITAHLTLLYTREPPYCGIPSSR